MEIKIHRLAEVRVVQISGALRLGSGVDNFRQAIDEALAAGDTRLVINFAEVPMIDSSGIGVLVKAMASAKQRGGAVKLLSPSKFVAQTLKLIGVISLFEIFTDENDAVQSFNSSKSA
jgi:anti-sigma B factor antagonist